MEGDAIFEYFDNNKRTNFTIKIKSIVFSFKLILVLKNMLFLKN